MQVIPARGLKPVRAGSVQGTYLLRCNAGNSREGFETYLSLLAYHETPSLVAMQVIPARGLKLVGCGVGGGVGGGLQCR